MGFEIGGVPEVFPTDITVELSLRLVAEQVLVEAPPSPPLKLLPTNLNMLKMKTKNETGTCLTNEKKIASQVRKTCLTSEKGCEVLHLLVNLVI